MWENQKPSEKYNLPVIGKIWLKPATSIFPNFNEIFGEDHSPQEYDVIQVRDNGNSKTYVVDAWNSPNVVQQIPDLAVAKFEEK